MAGGHKFIYYNAQLADIEMLKMRFMRDPQHVIEHSRNIFMMVQLTKFYLANFPISDRIWR